MKRHWMRLGVAVAAVACLGMETDTRSLRTAWLSRHAAVIHSIDPSLTVDEFADLNPIRAAIGKSRIVVLGEQSHGDGATFLAKARLVKFLHHLQPRALWRTCAWAWGIHSCS